MKVAIEDLEREKRELFQNPTNMAKHERVIEVGRRVEALKQIKEEDLRQWSRAYWLRLGDCNTKFFANMIRERRNTNSIYKLIGEDGKSLVKRQEIVAKCSEYFGRLFQEDSIPLNRIGRVFPEIVGDIENAELMRVPNREEIKGVVENLHLDKSPGPDGFNVPSLGVFEV